jgi:isoleucyl-tRNA synthetase
MKLINLLNEIKINKPNSTFTVTDKGKESYDNMSTFWSLYHYFEMDIEIFEHETSETWLEHYNFTRYIDEDIILLNETNSLDSTLEKGEMDYEIEEIKSQLQSFIYLKLITPIKL